MVLYTSIFFFFLDHYGIPGACVVSRDGQNMTYWGGALRNSRKCANGTCNCDINDAVWREDSGLFTYKEDLPIITMRYLTVHVSKIFRAQNKQA